MAIGTIYSTSTGVAQPDPSTDLPADLVSTSATTIIIETKDPVTGIKDGTVLVLTAAPGDQFVFDLSGTLVGGTIATVEHYDATLSTLYADLTGVNASAFVAATALASGDVDAFWSEIQSGDDTWTSADGDGSEIFGEDGNDFITGSAFADTLYGGAGDDTLRGGAGDDTLIGYDISTMPLGEFNRVDFRDATGSVTINLTGGLNSTTSTATGAGIGTDTLVNVEMAYGSDFADTVTIQADFGNRFGDFFEFEGGAGNDTLDASLGGTARAGYRLATDSVTIDLDLGTAYSTNAGDTANVGIDTLINVHRVRGSEYGDFMYGTSSFDEFRPRGGNDYVDGRGSLDGDRARYTGASSSVVIDLGTDNQTIAINTTSDGFGGIDTLIGIERLRGGRYDDDLRGDMNNNELRGDDGNDYLEGKGGNDDLRGDDGNDILIGGDGNDTLRSGVGFDLMQGGAGNDTLIGDASSTDFARIDYRDAIDDVSITLTGGVGSFASSATSRNGGDAANIGTDTLDSITYIFGSDHDDIVTVDGSYQAAFGNFIEFEGGAGNDEFYANGSGRIGYRTALDGVTVDLNTGTGQSTNAGDTANVGVDNFGGINQIRGSEFDDTLQGTWNGGYEGFRPRGGNDFVDGRGGFNDEVRYFGASGSVIVDLGANNQNTAIVTDADGFGGTDTILGIEQLQGGQYNDQLFGDNNNNRLRGEGGDDILDGRGGNDELYGGDGDDTLISGLGGDRLEGGAGDDTLIQDQQLDPYYDGASARYESATSRIVVNLSTTSKVYGDDSVGTDTLIGITDIRGTNFDDVFFADANFDNMRPASIGGSNLYAEFEGRGGDDEITGNGATRVSYRTASDSVTVDLGSGAFSTNAGDTAGIGIDTFFGGVTQVRGSNFARWLGDDGFADGYRKRSGLPERR